MISTKSFSIVTLDSPRFPPNLHRIFSRYSVMIWRAHEFNNLLLSPPKFRRTLIVYFQLIMQFFTETDTDVSAAQAERGGQLRK